MKGWMKFSPLVEIDLDLTLKQVQDGLVKGGNALLNRLAAVHPDADAVHAALEDIKSRLDDHFEDISDTWVTTHVLVGKEKRLILKTAVRQVSMSIFFIRQLCLMCMCSIYLLCSGDIAGNHQLRACVVLPLQ
jgi:hypothetical protein